MCVHLLCVYLTRRGSKVLTDDYRRIMLAPPPTRIFPQLHLFLLRSTSSARRRLWWCSNKADRFRLDTDLTGVTRASGRRRSACAQQDKTGLYLKIFAPSTCDHVWSTKRVLIAMFVFHYYSLDSNMLWWFFKFMFASVESYHMSAAACRVFLTSSVLWSATNVSPFKGVNIVLPLHWPDFQFVISTYFLHRCSLFKNIACIIANRR